MNFQIVIRIIQFLGELRKITKSQLKDLNIFEPEKEKEYRKILNDNIEELDYIIEYVKDYYDL